ncbi:unnamed protein product [Nippostrongylus brasiliensis]|uniref:Cytochrome P450 n=1 Tax=Nippostrongylus brasiliensis TaxID=27835 RepID=A0A0N4Y5W9_NIPBR|nr:unnamed protein product [Nippostrongylus brasiliensis]
MLFSIAFIAFSSLFVLYVWRYYENVKRYPNGPRPYPFVGNLLSLDVHKIHEEIPKLSKTYGSVFTLWLPRPYVVLTDHKSIKEAFATKGLPFSRISLFSFISMFFPYEMALLPNFDLFLSVCPAQLRPKIG